MTDFDGGSAGDVSPDIIDGGDASAEDADYTQRGLAIVDDEEIRILREVFLGIDPGLYSLPTLDLHAADPGESGTASPPIVFAGPNQTLFVPDPPPTVGGETMNTAPILYLNVVDEPEATHVLLSATLTPLVGPPAIVPIMHAPLDNPIPLGGENPSGVQFPANSVTVRFT